MSELKQNLLEGVPYYGMDEGVSHGELEEKGKALEEAAAAAHEALYLGFHEGNPQVGVFDDPDSESNGQYIGFRDGEGEVCFGPWDPNDQGSDIGLRAANPDYKGVLNPTTVLHADLMALVDFQRRGAPKELIEAIDAAVLFANFTVKKIAIPYLEQVAEAFEKDPKKYVDHFFPEGQRAHTIQRTILYHANAPEGMRPTSQLDGAELLIKEHKDKTSFTIDTRQSSTGLEYFVDGIWRSAKTKIACFRGANDDLLTTSGEGSLTPSTFHRALYLNLPPEDIPPHLASRGLVRAAMPLFVSQCAADARRVKANSTDTHAFQR